MDNQFQHAEPNKSKSKMLLDELKNKKLSMKRLNQIKNDAEINKDNPGEWKKVLEAVQNELAAQRALAAQNALASSQKELEDKVAAILNTTENRAVRKACRLYLNYDNIIKDTWLQTQLTKAKLLTFIQNNKLTSDDVISENKVEEKQETTDKIAGEMLLSFDGKALYVKGDIRIKKDNVWLRFASDTEATFCVDGTLSGSWCLRDKDKRIDSSEACKRQLDNVTNVLYEGSPLEEIKHAFEERARNVLRVQHASKEVQQAVEPDAIFRSRVLAVKDATNYRALDPLYNRDIEKEKQNVKMAKNGVVKVAFVTNLRRLKREDDALRTDKERKVIKNKRERLKQEAQRLREEARQRRITQRQRDEEAEAQRELDEAEAQRQRDEAEVKNDLRQILEENEAEKNISYEVEEKEMEDSDDDLSMLMSDKHVLDSLASLSESDGVQDVGVSSESEVDVREMDALLGSDSDTEFQFAATSDEDVSLTSMLNTFASDEDEEEEVKWASTSSGAD